jgi:hypothetical protein
MRLNRREQRSIKTLLPLIAGAMGADRLTGVIVDPTMRVAVALQ